MVWREGHGFAAVRSRGLLKEELAFGQHMKVERKGSCLLSGKEWSS